MSPTRKHLHPHVLAIMEETGEDDPVAAVRAKARSVIEEFHGIFREAPPFNLAAMASCRGLHASADPPRYSPDAEIAPEEGRVVLRVNRDRPFTRQRFSIGHEIGHTLFPDYQLAVRCRKEGGRDWADPADVLETLCDVAASEFLFPAPWFTDRVDELELSADTIAGLATEYQASRDATVRRVVELHPKPMAAVFFSWKHKPTELAALRCGRRQRTLFVGGMSPPERKLRVDYAVINAAFASRYTDHIPKDKSIESKGAIYEASVGQVTCDGTQWIDLGTVSGEFAARVLPVYTPDDQVGPNGAVSVVTVLMLA